MSRCWIRYNADSGKISGPFHTNVGHHMSTMRVCPLNSQMTEDGPEKPSCRLLSIASV
jgi:hypothetical protein